jgi:hypothetical protein
MKLCYGCQHFYIDMAESAYSEMTPGTDWDMACTKSKWFFDTHKDDVDRFRACLETATTCPLFSKRKIQQLEARRG